MLEDFVALKAGDVVVQNAANSMVGQTVIQLCKLKGVKTINLVRARPDLGATVDYLKSIGGDVVVPEECVLHQLLRFACTCLLQHLQASCDTPPPEQICC